MMPMAQDEHSALAIVAVVAVLGFLGLLAFLAVGARDKGGQLSMTPQPNGGFLIVERRF